MRYITQQTKPLKLWNQSLSVIAYSKLNGKKKHTLASFVLKTNFTGQKIIISRVYWHLALNIPVVGIDKKILIVESMLEQ